MFQKFLPEKLAREVSYFLTVVFYHKMNSGHFTWPTRGTALAQMKSAAPSQMFISPTFDAANFGWKLVAYPNGKNADNINSFDVFVMLASIPPQFDFIESCIRIHCNETNASLTMYRRFRKMKGFGWTRNTMLFSEIKTLDSLSFTVTMFVHKIVSIESQQILFERRITIKHQRIHWNLDQSVLHSLQRSHSGKSFESPIFDEMWCIRLHCVSSQIYIELQLCAFPNGKHTVNMSWTVDAVMIENGTKKITEPVTTDLEIRYSEFVKNDVHRCWIKMLMMSDIAECDVLQFNVDITVHDHQRTVDHYIDLNNPSNDPERERNRERIGIYTATNPNAAQLVAVNLQSMALVMDKVMNRLANIQDQFMRRTQTQFDEIKNMLTTNTETQSNDKFETTTNQFERRWDLSDARIQTVNIQQQSMKQSRGISSIKNSLSIDTERHYDNESDTSIQQWLRDIVKLPEYIPNFIDNGFRNMDVVRECTDEILKQIGIKAVGHRLEILMHSKRCKVQPVASDSKVAKSLNSGTTMKTHSDIEYVQKLKANHERAIKELLQCWIPQLNQSKIAKCHSKCEELRLYVERGHPVGSLRHQKSKDKKYIPQIKAFIASNMLSKQSSDLIEIYEVTDHQRCPKLNGTKGSRSTKFIKKGTVIGEYAVKCWMVSDLEILQSTKMYNEINKYAFDATVEVEMTLEQIQYFQRSGLDDIDNVRGPPRKKRKKNEVKHTFKIVLDGHSVEPKGMLCFMNDCRSNMEVLEPTEEDEKYWNCKFVTTYVRGWPRIFGVAIKDIGAGEELLTYYGDYAEVLKQEEGLKVRDQRLRDILKPIGMDHVVDDFK